MGDAEDDREPAPDERPPDLYEARYMRPAGRLLYRTKLVVPRLWHAIVGGPALMVLVAIAVMTAAGAPAVLPLVYLPSLLVLAAVWMLLAVIRVTVSTEEVYVQYGLWGPKIAVGSIERCEAVEYDWRDVGGWGISRAPDGASVYNMPNDGGRAVRIEWRDAKGRRQKVLVGCPDNATLAAAILRARAEASGAQRSGVRAVIDDEAADETAAPGEAPSAARATHDRR